MAADELGGGETAAQFVIEFPGPGHELGRDLFGIGVAVGFSLGQDVPDGDKELAGDGDACPEPVEGMAFCLPMRTESLSKTPFQ